MKNEIQDKGWLLAPSLLSADFYSLKDSLSFIEKKGGDVIPAFGKIGKPDYSASFLTTGFTTAPERRQRVHTLMVRTVPSAS